MSTPHEQSQWLDELAGTMRREVAAQREAIERHWDQPLPDRIREGRTLGPLVVRSAAKQSLSFHPQTTEAALADTQLREGDFVRLSRDHPAAPSGHYFYLGEDADGIHLARWKGDPVPTSGSGWTIDPDFFDLSHRFAEAIDALGATTLGRDRILPLLMGHADSVLDYATYERTMDELASGAGDWHPSQQDAIASCLAAHDAFLVQGPPGTGKTHVLAEVARRLIAQGQRILVTGPTHRAIDHALAAVRKALPSSVPVSKIGPTLPGGGAVPSHDSYLESDLAASDAPHVIGATPHSLWSNYSGLRSAHFDTILLDEASQLTPLLAAMAMLRAERWLFFGDNCQLPPVVLTDHHTPPERRSVFGILKHRDFDALLEESWRLNAPLAAWPSAHFYHGRLTVRHDRRLSLAPPAPPDLAALQPDPSLVLLVNRQLKASVRNEEEAQTATDLVRALVAGGLRPSEIGIVTPFRAQAARIRQLLSIAPDQPGLARAVLCDTVERFQGQEREVIIVSFVASSHPFIELRADFLFQPQRLNVAVTRGRVKTIILASHSLLKASSSLAEAGHQGAACFCSLLQHLANPDAGPPLNPAPRPA